MEKAIEEILAKGRAAREASRRLAYLSTEIKNRALYNIADDLLAKKGDILAANRKDFQEAKASGMGAAMLDRLMLDENRLKSISDDVRTVAALPDPVGAWSSAANGCPWELSAPCTKAVPTSPSISPYYA
jgi:glutamate-5-semialdehyde dehydrogenase